MSLPIVILAGGASERMAPRDKLLEEIEGQPLLRLQADRALAVSDNVIVILRPGSPARRAALDGARVRIVETAEALEGMGGSLRAAVAAVGPAPAFLLLLPDLVEITPDHMRRVIDAHRARPEAALCRGATETGAPGHPMIITEAAYPGFAALSGDDGGRDVAAALAERGRVTLVPLPGDTARRDLDTPEDWARWRAERRRDQV